MGEGKIKYGLKFKLILILIMLVSIPLIISGIISYQQTSNALKKESEDKLLKLSQLSAENLNQILEAKKEMVGVLADLNIIKKAAINNVANVEVSDTLKDLVNNSNGEIESIVLMNSEGKVIASGDDNKSVGLDLKERKYFIDTKNGKTVVSDIVISKLTGNLVVPVAAPVKNGEFIGSVAIIVPFKMLSEVVDGLKIGETGYAYLIDKTGLLVAHPKKEKILKENLTNNKSEELREVVNKMKAGEHGYGFYTYEGVTKFLGYYPVENWSLGVTLPVDEYMTAAYAIRNFTLFEIGIFMIIGALIAFIYASNLSKPIITVVQLMEKVQTGDLRIKSEINRNDELGLLGIGFNSMIDHLKELIYQVNDATTQVASSSEELSATSEESTAASEEVASTVSSLATGSIKQVEELQETGGVIHDMSASIQEIAATVQDVSDSSVTAANIAEEGKLAAIKAISTIEQVRKTVGESADVIKRLGEQSNQIGQIVDVIKGIADQTNLLALNAAIEAARAGEQGRGFAVVAEEVRKLAEQSSYSAEQIAGLIHTIQAETQKAVEVMELGTKEVDLGVEAVNNAGISFENINNTVATTTEQIKQVAIATNEIANGSTTVVMAIEKIVDVAKLSADAAEEVTSTAHEQSCAMEAIAESANNLAILAEGLQKHISKFKI